MTKDTEKELDEFGSRLHSNFLENHSDAPKDLKQWVMNLAEETAKKIAAKKYFEKENQDEFLLMAAADNSSKWPRTIHSVSGRFSIDCFVDVADSNKGTIVLEVHENSLEGVVGHSVEVKIGEDVVISDVMGADGVLEGDVTLSELSSGGKWVIDWKKK